MLNVAILGAAGTRRSVTLPATCAHACALGTLRCDMDANVRTEGCSIATRDLPLLETRSRSVPTGTWCVPHWDTVSTHWDTVRTPLGHGPYPTAARFVPDCG